MRHSALDRRDFWRSVVTNIHDVAIVAASVSWRR